ncbi:peptidase P60 [Trinickia symbiotica]|uniref:Peptidase P60 n=1 Tax=Trinickia symbiotica TaxID=863227 RepID=A0A2T3XTU6_9BURK|nr:C40 family peptidase [Trinickia symbiotica]PTB19872.1 peptidase P60 [Trinickia symbiotica]
MQHRYFAQARSRVVTVMLVGALMTAAASAFADEANNLSQSTAISIQPGAAPTPLFAAPSPDSQAAPAPMTSGGRAKAFLSGMAGKAGDVVVGALNMIGVRYRWGGDSPDSGLDCSGFVRYVFQDTLGLALPRRAEEMSRVGEKVRISDLKPGDLVFFHTMRRTFSHVGIYIGDNKFVHSPSTGSTIRVDDLDDRYWEKRFTGARRVETDFPAEQLRQRVSMDAKGSN